MVASHFRTRSCAWCSASSPLLIGGNPFSVTCVYSLINALERRYGVHWAMGGTGTLVAGWSVCRRAGRPNCAERRGEADRVDNGRARGVRWPTANASRRHRGLQRRHRLDLPPPGRARAPAALDRPQDRARPRYSMSLFVWYFGTNGATTTCRTTPWCSGRATRAC
jgi:phytoene desaturase